MTMTEKQKRVYDYYRQFSWLEKQPTYEQASKDLWTYPSVVYSHIVKLEKKWYIRRDGAWRIYVVDEELWAKIINIAHNLRPEIKFPDMKWIRTVWVDLLRCAVLQKQEENKKMYDIFNNIE